MLCCEHCERMNWTPVDNNDHFRTEPARTGCMRLLDSVQQRGDYRLHVIRCMALIYEAGKYVIGIGGWA